MSHKDEAARVCGFLNIEEAEFSGSFCRRYFILDVANRKLAYYMDSPLNLPESWKSPVGEIYLQYINKVADAKTLRPKVVHCFVVSVAGRQYFLQADCEDTMKGWISALNAASKISVPLSDKVNKGTEWHAADLSHTGYITEIAGGVVCKMPMQVTEDSDSGSEEEDSHSSQSIRSSPTSLLPRQLTASFREVGGGGEVQRSEGVNKIVAIKSGYAVKQGAVRKNWKRRYFVLHEDGLSYFKSELDKQPIRTVSVLDITGARAAEGANVSRDNLLEILTSKRVFFLQCDSPADMASWIKEITTLLSARNTPKKTMQVKDSKAESEDSTKTYPQSIWV